jgi:uncharacterized membrane protein YidH (DUF202 family)
MSEAQNSDTNGHNSGDVVTLLTKLTELEEKQAAAMLEQNDLAKRRTETTSSLALYSATTAENAEKQTGLAQERTALTREQTRLSTRSAELANIRTDLAQDRTFQAQERSRLATQRTEMARLRTSLSEWRTRLAEGRTDLAHERTIRAVTRTRFSLQRTELAKGRTSLALIRTGLAFLTLGITFFRYFGISMWTFFDAALVLFSTLMIYYGAVGYHRSKVTENRLIQALARDAGTADLLAAGMPPDQRAATNLKKPWRQGTGLRPGNWFK